MSEDLTALVRAFAEEELTLDRQDIGAEARANLAGFGFDPGGLDPRQVELALVEVSELLRDRFAGARGPVTFYAWYDRQAGQLRCSLASTGPDGLPFGGRFRPVDEPGPVLAELAADKNPGVVVWEDLADASEEPGDAEAAFPVFATQVVPSGETR